MRKFGAFEMRDAVTGVARSSSPEATLRRIDVFLIRWARRKFKRLRQQPKGARDWLARVVRSSPDLFAHWPLLYGQGRTLGAV
jgi:hypothetical protein